MFLDWFFALLGAALLTAVAYILIHIHLTYGFRVNRINTLDIQDRVEPTIGED